MGQTPEADLTQSLAAQSEEYCSYHDYNEHQTIHSWALRRSCIQQSFLKEYVLTPQAIF